MSIGLTIAPAIVLCAGHGTRLRPLTDELPKPLVPVGDRPLLAHVVGRLVAAGVGPIAVNTHHLPDRFHSVIDGLGAEVRVFYETSIRGTAGGIAGARDVLAPGPCLVHNGDIVVDAPVSELLLEASKGGLALAVAPRGLGEGAVGIDAAGRVVRLRGEVFGDEVRGGDYVGVAALGPDALAALPDMGCLVGDFALPRMRVGALRIVSVPVTGPWSDVGTIDAYLAENIVWLRRRSGARRAWIGPGARVEDRVRLIDCVIGAGARLDGVGAMERCVVWPGARATAPLTDAVVTAGGRVVRAPS